MHYYDLDMKINYKTDKSPVTIADLESSKIITNFLRQLTPNIPVISEEENITTENQGLKTCWLVDPLDGTRGFIKHKNEFTVNIALVENGFPVLGFLHIPTAKDTYFGGDLVSGAYKIDAESNICPIQVAPISDDVDDLRILVSSDHSAKDADLLQGGKRISESKSMASALKFCIVAEGIAHAYPRRGPTMEWDTAAGQAIVEAAGGVVLDAEGKRLSYGKKDYLNGSFIAACNASVVVL